MANPFLFSRKKKSLGKRKKGKVVSKEKNQLFRNRFEAVPNVLSRYKFPSIFNYYMRKLNKNKVCWIVRECGKGELSKWQIAKQMKVSRRWVNHILVEYEKTGSLPIPGRPGRTPVPITATEIEFVKSFKKEYCTGQ